MDYIKNTSYYDPFETKQHFVKAQERIDVRFFKLDPHTPYLTAHGQRFLLAWQPCFSTVKPWFICPADCGRWARYLYRVEGRWACRQCHGLVYESQWQSKETRLYFKEHHLNLHFSCPKPKWKRWPTHQKGLMELIAVSRVLEAIRIAGAGRCKRELLKLINRQTIEAMGRGETPEAIEQIVNRVIRKVQMGFAS